MQYTDNKLAIVIPAFKVDFFGDTIKSIMSQTCKKFTLYIGDDAGPKELRQIVEQYKDLHPIIYKRFEKNLGGKNLVQQWMRCIEMVEDEEWIWFFSDDDTMSSNCVEMFYKKKEEYPNHDLYRFNFRKIDENNNIISVNKINEDIISVEDLLTGRLTSSLQTTIVEYIFRKEKYFQVNGFQYFDLAWGSDDATWIKIGKERGIRTIGNTVYVNWRRSVSNISSLKSVEIVNRKMLARCKFSEWIITRYKKGELDIQYRLLINLIDNWLNRFLLNSASLLSLSKLFKLQLKINKLTYNDFLISIKRIIMLIVYKIKFTIKNS